MALNIKTESTALVKKSDESKVVFIQKVIKGETYLVMAQSAVELEDEFSSLYYTASSQGNLFLMPPFEPNVLLNFVQTNNVLNQCIEAMEVNIDGTGHEFVAVDEEEGEPNQDEVKRATGFFNEPYPNLHFVALRRKLRRQMESVGYAFLEILRGMDGKIVGLRNIETQHVRMVKLDQPVQVKKKIEREGKEVELTIWERERRYAQTVALKDHVYYREYGTSRMINRETGEWETKEKPVPPDKQGTELLIFGINPDITTPYYLPRWINQLPSVVGSRNAEEQNLQFLDAGGMPPAIIFVQGGALVKESSDQLRMYLSGMNKNKNRAVVVEVQSSTGSLDSNAKVEVKVERFGAEQAKDAMFMKYDAAAEEHVRIGFRLPPLFLGKADDYNFATAKTSYMVAEAQVFAPERTDFDEVINKTIMKELGFKSIKFKSLPITLKDAEAQLKGLELAKDVATRDTWTKEMNTVSGMALEAADEPVVDPSTGQPEPREHPPAAPTPLPFKPAQPVVDLEKNKEKEKEKPKEKKTAIELIDLAHDFAAMHGLIRKHDVSPERRLLVEETVGLLPLPERHTFDTLVTEYTFGDHDPDLVAVAKSALDHIARQ